jgi:uncharacterized OB-fold protein
MKCLKCGSKNRPDARFCQQCGQPLEAAPFKDSELPGIVCPACGAIAKPSAHYCKQCGQSLAGVLPEASLPPGLICAVCGAAAKPQAHFCPRCGEKLLVVPVSPISLAAAQPTLPPRPPPRPQAKPPIKAKSSGQVAVGGGINIKIGSVHGGQVNISIPKQTPPIRLRSQPLPPPPSAALLDRETEVKTADAALRSSQPVEFYGQAGLGKTTLLQHLARHGPAASFATGVVYLSLLHKPAADLLQDIFDVFYERDKDYKPTEPQIRAALKRIRALIVLDDIELSRDEVNALLSGVPSCTFLLASAKRCLWGQGRSIALQGLPLDAALAFMEREMGRSLARQERPAAESLCNALKGNPLYLLRAAVLVRDNKLSPAEVLQRVQQVTPPSRALTTQLLTSLSEKGRQILAALAALDGVSLRTEHLAALAGLPDVVPVLKPLLQQGLVQAYSPRYSLAGDLGQTLQQAWNLTPWAERSLAYFTAWAEGRQFTPDQLVEEIGPILRVLEWAVAANRWAEVLRLGRAVEGDLALTGQWGAWAQVLEWILKAVRGLGNRAAEAWALHQLGARALCLGDAVTARSCLNKALQLRQALGDQAGAAATQHNLNQLFALYPAPQPAKPAAKPAPAGRTATPSWWERLVNSLRFPTLGGPVPALIMAVAVVMLVGGILALGLGVLPPKVGTPAAIGVAPTPTRTATPTPSPLPSTATPVPTRTSTPVNTSTRVPPTSTRVPSTSTPVPPTPTPVPPTSTPVPPTSTPVPPTSTPVPPAPTPVPPTPTPFISFRAIPATINQGQCSTLEWQIENVQAIYLSGGEFDNQGVTGPSGSEQACPPATTTYTLRVVLQDNSEETYTATVTVIPAPSPTPVVLFDFVDEASSAQWISGAGILPFPGTDTDERGFALWRYNYPLEDGSRPARVLETHPEWVDNGYIYGVYNLSGVVVEAGDRLVAEIGFISGAGAGSATFNFGVNYGQYPDCGEFGCTETFSFFDNYDGQIRRWEVSLPSKMIGQKIGSISLRVDAGPTPAQDWAVWSIARLERP